MQKHLFLPVILIAALFSCAQNRTTAMPAADKGKQTIADTIAKPYWQISLGKQSVLRTGEENKERNQVILSKDQLQQSLSIAYYDDDPSLYIRSFIILNAEGNPIYRSDSTTKLNFSATEFANLWKGNSVLDIQTIGVPSDPDLAARIRLRPRHLCTFVLR